MQHDKELLWLQSPRIGRARNVHVLEIETTLYLRLNSLYTP